MGWGTFLLGRALRERRPQSSLSDDLKEITDNYYARQADFESAVLSEIQLLNSQGEVVDLEAVRINVKKMRKAYQQLGSKLDLMVVKEAQKRTLAGESINYKEIERELILTYRHISLGSIFRGLYTFNIFSLYKFCRGAIKKIMNA